MRFLVILCLLLGGCASVAPQRGGVATIGEAIMSPIKAIGSWGVGHVGKPVKNAITANPKPIEAPEADGGMTMAQPDNPASNSTQNLEITHEEEILFAASTTVVVESDGVRQTINIPAGSKKTVKETRKAGQVIGAAQKDTARADAAWLASFQWVQGVGVLVMLIGVIGYAHPAARALIGGKGTAMAVGISGAVMIFGPAFLQKYGNWFALALIGAAGYWFVSRMSYKEAEADTLKSISTPPFPK